MKLRPRAAGSVFGCSRQALHFGCVHGFLYEDGCPIHDSLKAFLEWMLSVGAISILERLAAGHDKFYERLLARLDIRVQEYISSCADAAKAEAIESSLLNLDTIKQNLRLQNVSDLAGAVFPETTLPTTGGGKRPAERGASEGTKSKPAPNQNPHQSLVLTSYAGVGQGPKVRLRNTQGGRCGRLRTIPLPPDLQHMLQECPRTAICGSTGSR
jgi:hypothetical protein